MKKETKKSIYAVIGVLILITKVYEIFTKPNFGFAGSWSAEGIGFNFAHLGLIALGILLTYQGLKKEKIYGTKTKI